jgi:hypothetical protein
LSWERLRAELAGGDPGRQDEMLAALVRVARWDRQAVAVVVGALAPGVRARIARYAPGLPGDDAWSIAVEGLCAARSATSSARLLERSSGVTTTTTSPTGPAPTVPTSCPGR